jgi:hypothetical protein
MTNPEVAYRASSNGIEERNELVLRELPQVYYVAASDYLNMWTWKILFRRG